MNPPLESACQDVYRIITGRFSLQEKFRAVVPCFRGCKKVFQEAASLFIKNNNKKQTLVPTIIIFSQRNSEMGFFFFGRSMALSKQQLMNKSLFKDLKCDTGSLLENIQVTKYMTLRGENCGTVF